jgi:CRP/FNR family transcriptional regulator, cyclic AMP receptor protein
MAIATASLDLDQYPRTSKVSPPPPPQWAALQSSDLFVALPPASLRALADASTIKNLTRGSMIAGEGALLTHAFLVLRGRARAVRRGENGREITVEIFRPGDLVADAVIGPEEAVSNDCEAVEATTVLLIPCEALLAQMRALPELSLAISRHLVRRLNRSKDLAVGLALSDVQGRVVSALRTLARHDGQALPEGALIRHRPTQQELANSIGACRETVSRIVSDLVRKGLLTPRGRGLLLSKRLDDPTR